MDLLAFSSEKELFLSVQRLTAAFCHKKDLFNNRYATSDVKIDDVKRLFHKLQALCEVHSIASGILQQASPNYVTECRTFMVKRKYYKELPLNTASMLLSKIRLQLESYSGRLAHFYKSRYHEIRRAYRELLVEMESMMQKAVWKCPNDMMLVCLAFDSVVRCLTHMSEMPFLPLYDEDDIHDSEDFDKSLVSFISAMTCSGVKILENYVNLDDEKDENGEYRDRNSNEIEMEDCVSRCWNLKYVDDKWVGVVVEVDVSPDEGLMNIVDISMTKQFQELRGLVIPGILKIYSARSGISRVFDA